MIKALFFDLHEVIFTGSFHDSYRSFAEKMELSSEEVTKFHQDNLPGLLVGSVTVEDEMDHFGFPKSDREHFLKTWAEVIADCIVIDQKMAELLEQLRKNYSLTALTNLSPTRYGADMAMGVYDYFDHEVLSFKEGCKKPDPKIFEIALQRADVKPDEAVFVDDQKKNTDAASALGIHSIQFQSYGQLLEEFRELGVEI